MEDEIQDGGSSLARVASRSHGAAHASHAAAIVSGRQASKQAIAAGGIGRAFVRSRMSSKAARRLKRLAVSSLALLLLANAAAYGGAWAACRLALRPARNTLRWLGHRRSVQRTPQQFGLHHERHGFPSQDGTFLDAWLIPVERSRAVVAVFHGYGANKGDLLREAREFHAMDLDVLLVDFRGSGGSEGNETSIGFHEAKDVRAAVNYARGLPGRPRVIAYGISMGSAAILKAEADGVLGARALILECPFDRLQTAVDRRLEERRMPAFPLSPLLVFWGGWRQGFDGFTHNPVEYARSVRTPVLLIAGDEDLLVRPEETASIALALAANGQLLTCPGVGHAPCSRGPADLWRHRVGHFVDQVLGPRERAARPTR